MGDAIAKTAGIKKPMRQTGWMQSIWKESSVANHLVGECRQMENGEIYQYCKAGGALAAGKLAAQDTVSAYLLQETTYAAIAAGATEFTFNPGGSVTLTADQLKGGFLCVSADSGGTPGSRYKIRGNGAVSGETNFTIYLDEPVRVAISASAVLDIIVNPANGVTNLAFDGAGEQPVGFPRIAVTSGYYFWAQKKGICMVYTEDHANLDVGEVFIPSTSVAGGVAIVGTNTTADVIPLGYVISMAAGANCFPVACINIA